MAALVEGEFGKQVAMLVAGVINSHILNCDMVRYPGTIDTCDGCCPVCCAPCAALAWFRDNPLARNQLAHWFADWDPGWDWCEPDGQIKWAEVEKHWTLTECHGGVGEEEREEAGGGRDPADPVGCRQV